MVVVVVYISKSTMATELELNHLDHKMYSAIKQIRGKKIAQMLKAYLRKLLKY